MSAIPYIPFYISDYLADTAHLSAEEHGAYLLLIMNYWQRGKSLPNDDAKLSKIANLRLDRWKKVRNLLSEFFIVNETEWRHKRIEKELAKFHQKSEKARLAGQKSGEKRREKSLTNVEHPLNERSASVEQTLNHTDTDTDTDTEEDKETPPAEVLEKLPAADFSPQPSTPEIPKAEEVPKLPPCPHEKIIALYHERLPTLPRYLKRTATRDDHMRARWKENPDIRLWEQFFDLVAQSNFLMGKVFKKDRRPFITTLDWLIKPENFAKVLEDKYVD